MDLLNLSDDALDALARQVAAAKKAKKTATQAQYGDRLGGFVAYTLDNNEISRSYASDWVGVSVSAIPVEHDGRRYTVSVTITDIDEKAARTQAFKIAKDAADAQRLTGDARKEAIAADMRAYDDMLAEDRAQDAEHAAKVAEAVAAS